MRRVLLALVTMACVLPATAGAATLHATTSTFASTVAAAQPGDTVMLASGSYGAWKGVTKTSPGVTITPEAGATPSMSLAWDTLGSPAWLTLDGITVTGGQVSGPTHDVTVKNSTFPGYLQINPGASPGANNACGNCPAMSDNHIVFDNNLFNLSSCPSGSCLGYEGRISFAYQGPNPAGVTVKNSTFTTGCADGVQFVGSAGRGVTIGPGNKFVNLKQGSCSPHVDAIQFVGGNGATITGNLFSGNTTSIASYDGGTTGVTVSDNVFTDSEVSYPILFGGDNGAVIEHNTLAAGLHINLTSKSGASSRNEIIRNNITPGGVTLANGVGGNATPTVNDYNLCSNSCAGASSMTGAASYVGPTSTYAGWALTAGSMGKGNASDGSDRGVRFTAGPPPPADTTPPNTTIGSGPANPTTSTSATFAFSSNESGSFECKLDAGAYASCSSPKAYTGLSSGSHTFSVRATDAAGNVDASAATQTWTISTAADTTAPDTTITSGPANPTTETTSSSGFTSTESGSTFTCKLDAGAYASCSSPKANSGLSMGSHTFSVRATDAAGNMDATPASQTWMIQSAPPADSQPVAAYVYSPTAPAAGQAVLFDASSATCADAPCSYSWADDGTDGSGGTQWPLGSGKTLSFTFQGTGVKNVRLVVTDADGDTDNTMKSITVAATAPPADTTAPSTTIDSGPTNITTNDNTPTFTFSSSEPSTFQCKADSGAWAGCTSPWTTSALSDGAHNVSVRATDAAGNVDATPSTRSFTVSTATSTPQNLLGSSTVQSVPDSNAGGSAEAFSATASGSGKAVSLSIYIGSSNSAGTMVAGIYTDANGHPGTLLTKGTRSSLTAAGWNKVTVPAATLTSGSKYWIALLGTGGTLKFRDGAGSSACRSEGSRSSSLTTLPATWRTGASFASCPLSGYATS